MDSMRAPQAGSPAASEIFILRQRYISQSVLLLRRYLHRKRGPLRKAVDSTRLGTKPFWASTCSSYERACGVRACAAGVLALILGEADLEACKTETSFLCLSAKPAVPCSAGCAEGGPYHPRSQRHGHKQQSHHHHHCPWPRERTHLIDHKPVRLF